ncbi:hypothetical protein [Nocardiopsis sp. CA-288880]|uniref:hypothetical protein n=1 Tax=Nocardiopsis sp. CA-288880 TaxID=3239995 RepID=UPI003D996157
MGELAARLEVGLPTTGELVGDLSGVGLVVRRQDPANRRRVLLSPAEEYRDPMRAFASRRVPPLLRAFERLTPAERQGFSAGLRARAHEAHPS